MKYLCAKFLIINLLLIFCACTSLAQNQDISIGVIVMVHSDNNHKAESGTVELINNSLDSINLKFWRISGDPNPKHPWNHYITGILWLQPDSAVGIRRIRFFSDSFKKNGKGLIKKVYLIDPEGKVRDRVKL